MKAVGVYIRLPSALGFSVMKNQGYSATESFWCARRLVFTISAAILIAFGTRSALAQAPVPDSPAIEAKAHEMLAKLTLEQKIELIGGHNEMFTYAETTIGLPKLKMSDAFRAWARNLRRDGCSTEWAAGMRCQRISLA
jgi:hypothetical protein